MLCFEDVNDYRIRNCTIYISPKYYGNHTKVVDVGGDYSTHEARYVHTILVGKPEWCKALHINERIILKTDVIIKGIYCAMTSAGFEYGAVVRSC
jgi:hypothetical protein